MVENLFKEIIKFYQMIFDFLMFMNQIFFLIINYIYLWFFVKNYYIYK